jgi:hypothetical protein
VFTGVGAEILQTPYRTPIADAHAERFVRIVRSGCLDHLLVEDERHLKRVLRSYSCHYNSHRPIRGSAKACPERPHLRSISWRPGRASELDATSVAPCGDPSAGWPDPRIRASGVNVVHHG